MIIDITPEPVDANNRKRAEVIVCEMYPSAMKRDHDRYTALVMAGQREAQRDEAQMPIGDDGCLCVYGTRQSIDALRRIIIAADVTKRRLQTEEKAVDDRVCQATHASAINLGRNKNMLEEVGKVSDELQRVAHERDSLILSQRASVEEIEQLKSACRAKDVEIADESAVRIGQEGTIARLKAERDAYMNVASSQLDINVALQRDLDQCQRRQWDR